MEKISFHKLTVQQSLDSLHTKKGWLSNHEATQRQRIYWKNILKSVHKQRLFLRFLKQFKDALIILLVFSLIISIYLQDYRWATILWIIIIINAIIWYIQEARSERIMQSLKKLLHPSAKVIRDWKLIEEKVENLVPWDIVYIQEWDSIPADLRLIEENNLQTNDFSLTWESSPVNKFIHDISWYAELWEKNNIAFMWTTVATWEAYWVVISISMDTELWKIANLSQKVNLEATPLQKELENIAKKLTIWTILLGIILIIIALAADFSLTEAFIFAIWIAAAMVPQWLPAQVSVALSLASWRLAKKNALIKQLSSVETLWCVNVICTDKTWTLTKNEMTVKNIYLFNQSYNITWSWYEPNWEILWFNTKEKISSEFINTRKHFFIWSIINSTAIVSPPDKKHPLRYCMWDPTEAAIITMANKAQYDTDKIKKSYKRIWEYWFDSSRKMMSTACEIDGKKIIYVKWAIKNILDKCTKIFDWKQIKKITQKDKDRIIQNIDKFSIDAMRNISLAYKIIDKNIISMNMQETESDLVFLWFASIIDPPREEVPNAIYSAYQANIKIIMITWDYWLTAEAIAKKIWLSPGNKEILMIKWEEIRKKTDIQLLYDLRNPYIIFSRTSPEDKMRIVSLLKKENNIVAVTWDWVNDAPALKEANIWVSMWKIWTDVAKDASEIVLLDDSFSTLVNAIREWRIIYQNLKKTIISSLTSNGGELFAILISLLVKAFWHIPIAINPFQILAVDLIWEMWPLMMLTHDSAKPWLMQDKPRDVKNHLLNKKTILNLIIFWSLMWIIAFIAYISYFLIHNIYPFDLSTSSLNYMTGTSVTYTTIILCQYMNILSRRTWIDSIFNKYTLTNKKLWLSFFWWVLLVSILIYNPHISKYFWFWAMWIVDRLLPISWWIIYLIVREIKKYINRKNTQDNK